jgi:hypothetical protein
VRTSGVRGGEEQLGGGRRPDDLHQALDPGVADRTRKGYSRRSRPTRSPPFFRNGAASAPLAADVRARAEDDGAEAMALSAQVEAELAELEPADRSAFLADLGLTEGARDRFIRASYGLLDLISFLTTGEDECRAWRRGTTALKAAGKIHSVGALF